MECEGEDVTAKVGVQVSEHFSYANNKNQRRDLANFMQSVAVGGFREVCGFAGHRGQRFIQGCYVRRVK